MPSLQQTRREALAARVETARRSVITTVAGAVFGVPHDPVPARVERMDGSRIDLELEEVQLDAAELRGRWRKAAVVIPLDEVNALWVRRLRPRRAAAAYVGILGAVELALLPTMSVTNAPWSVMLVVPLLLAGPLCGAAWIVLKRLKAFQEWVLVYDRTGGA